MRGCKHWYWYGYRWVDDVFCCLLRTLLRCLALDRGDPLVRWTRAGVIGLQLNNVNNPPQSRKDKGSNVHTPVQDRKDKSNSFGAHPLVESPFLFCRSGGNAVLPPNSLLPIPGTLGMSNCWGLPLGMGSKRFPRTKHTFQNRGTFPQGPGNMGCKTTVECYAGIPKHA